VALSPGVAYRAPRQSPGEATPVAEDYKVTICMKIETKGNENGE